jgi:hypothetical protein
MSNNLGRCIVLLALLSASLGSFASVSAQADALQRRYDLIERETAELRGLPIQQEIDVTFKTSDQLRTELERDLDADYPPEQRDRDERILKAFGLVPQETDLSSLYVDLYSEQVAGYYDTETGEMVVIRPADSGDDLSPSQEITYAHEVVHALQDQNLGLDDSLNTTENTNEDESLALLALIEGDATVAQSEYLADRPGLLLRLTGEFMTAEIPTDQLDAAPSIIRESLLFPYSQGAAFVSALREEGDWGRVDEAYATPPTSTEQILHPEKYLSGEQPVPIDVPDIAAALGNGWTQLDDNAFGEFQLRVLLAGQSDSADNADAAAAGWGGDRYRVATNGDQTAVVWTSTWDSSNDAAEFAESLARYDEQRFGVERQPGEDGSEITISGNNIVTRVITEGERVTYVLAPDDATADRLR